MKRVALLGLATLALAAPVFAGDAVAVTRAALTADFRRNAGDANAKYLDRMLDVVDERARAVVGRDAAGDHLAFVVDQEGGEPIKTLICRFAAKDQAELATFRDGQPVRVRGRCKGLQDFGPARARLVTLDECRFIPWSRAVEAAAVSAARVPELEAKVRELEGEIAIRAGELTAVRAEHAAMKIEVDRAHGLAQSTAQQIASATQALESMSTKVAELAATHHRDVIKVGAVELELERERHAHQLTKETGAIEIKRLRARIAELEAK